MPIGIITNILCVASGGLTGGIIKKYLPEKLKESLPAVFAFSAMSIGIPLIIKAHSTSSVIFSLILGTIIGELLNLEYIISNGIKKAYKLLLKSSKPDEAYMNIFLTITVLFCVSGTGIFGAMNEGFTGDPSVLLSKSILDFFTAILFAAMLNSFVATISIPQAIIFFTLFLTAKLILPLLNESIILDFKAVGGVITLIAGFRMIGIKNVRIINVLPSLLLIFPISHFWAQLIK